jgi:hypothetical protein
MNSEILIPKNHEEQVKSYVPYKEWGSIAKVINLTFLKKEMSVDANVFRDNQRTFDDFAILKKIAFVVRCEQTAPQKKCR